MNTFFLLVPAFWLVSAEASSFVGPTGVGLGVGAICHHKNFSTGVLFSIERTRGHLDQDLVDNYVDEVSRKRRSPFSPGLILGALVVKKAAILGAVVGGALRAPSYQRGRHYSRSNSYYYSHSPRYYYSSTTNNNIIYNNNYGGVQSNTNVAGRRKRQAELQRVKRAAEEFEYEEYLLEMSARDQDDCMKKLVCQLAAMEAAGRDLTDDEQAILADFQGGELDVTKNGIAFQVAAKTGSSLGDARCVRMYARCATSLPDQLAMIQTEVKGLEPVRLELEEGLTAEEISKALEAEQQQIEEDLRDLGKEDDQIWE